MRPLTLDDLLPLGEFVSRRREFLESHERYLDRYRRVRIGPRLTLQFENRQTLWFQVQEILRVARLTEHGRVQQQLDLYNHLLPGRNELQAALVIEVAEEARLLEELEPWRNFEGKNLFLCLGQERLPARLITCRPEDHAIGAVHWVRFHLAEDQRSRLADLDLPAYFAVDHAGYRHESPPLAEEIRQSLLEDLEIAQRF